MKILKGLFRKKSKKWKQVNICKCGCVNVITNSQFQSCNGCKQYLSKYNIRKICYGRQDSDGIWTFKEIDYECQKIVWERI